MNRMWTIIFFIIMLLIGVGGYIAIYHKWKKHIFAIGAVTVWGLFIFLGVTQVIPDKSRATVVEEITSPITIAKKGANWYVFCEDGTDYKLKAMNTKMSSEYYSYQNDNKYQNEKVELTYRYDYRIYWIIPAHSFSKEREIYIDNDWVQQEYGCNLDIRIR